jgi:inhibitor of lysozyme (Ivy)
MKWIAALAIMAVTGLALCRPAWPQDEADKAQDEVHDLVYPSDLLKVEPYRSAWDAMLKGVKVDAWITKYSKTYDGVESPLRTIQVDGENYKIADVCKPHSCDTDFLYALFSPDGKHAWALVIGSRLQWLGQPEARFQRAITDQCTKDEVCQSHLH